MVANWLKDLADDHPENGPPDRCFCWPTEGGSVETGGLEQLYILPLN